MDVPEKWSAGADYLAALQRLGLEVEALLWAENTAREELVLVLVSSIVDRVGSTEIYDTLFKAYDHAVTPRSIDPWNVSVFSPASIFGSGLRDLGRDGFTRRRAVDATGSSDRVDFAVGDVEYRFQQDWVYVLASRPMESRRQLQIWLSFRENVERLAA